MTIDNSVNNAKSRYTQGGDTEAYDQRLGWWERDLETIKHASDDIFIQIAPKYDRRPDKFSADYFGNANMTWITLQFNTIVDINEEFVAGKTIRMPNTERAQFDFLNKSTGGVPPTTETT